MPSLLYIADPMCSWCYGFGPELTQLTAGLSDMPLHIMVGGLRTGNQPLNETLKEHLREHWASVSEKTGLPIHYDNLDREEFIYDTEPACRAVVAVRSLVPEGTLTAFHAIQHAFYAEGKDVTQGEVLAQIVSAALSEAGIAIDVASFLAAWNSDATRLTTQEDFAQVQRWQIQGFPTLVLERNGQLDLLTSGYVPVQTLVERMETVVTGTADKKS